MQLKSRSEAETVSTLADRPIAVDRRGSLLPLIAICGSMGKTSTGWLLVHALEATGLAPAAWLSDGVFIDHELRPDELRAWELATLAARARELDVLIQEVPSVLAQSLPEDSVWIAVLTTICGSDDQCRRDASTDLHREAVDRVAEALHPDGTLIANADDLLLAEAANTFERDSMFFALNPGNPVLRNHLDAGGDAVWIQNDWVKAHISGERFRVIKVSDLPSTLNGHLIFQAQNALAAIATLLKCSSDPRTTARKLRASFGSRCYLAHKGTQIREFDERTTIVDNPRSLAAVKQLVRGIRALGPKRIVLKLGSFSDLSDNEIAEASRSLGSLGGIAIIPIDERRAARLNLIAENLMTSSNPPAIARRDPREASLGYVESLLDEGDLALVIDEPCLQSGNGSNSTGICRLSPATAGLRSAGTNRD